MCITLLFIFRVDNTHWASSKLACNPLFWTRKLRKNTEENFCVYRNAYNLATATDGNLIHSDIKDYREIKYVSALNLLNTTP
jgi:hypothetical protein